MSQYPKRLVLKSVTFTVSPSRSLRGRHMPMFVPQTLNGAISSLDPFQEAHRQQDLPPIQDFQIQEAG